MPIKHLEQQFDLIYILENIFSFIQEYHYNFYDNIFIEDMNNKHISNSNVIKLENINYSLDTHGVGIINSIINKLYQLISKYLKNILEIALDDYIKSILISEEKNWINKINLEDNLYSLEKAIQFLSENENIIIELYSEIKKIGNIISLIRMIESALMKYGEILFIYNDISKLNNLNDIKCNDEKIQKLYIQIIYYTIILFLLLKMLQIEIIYY